jgi:DNA-binding transcriptional MerR regulator
LGVSAFTIGRLAEAAGVNVETVRYYERRGLLERPVRRGSEYREYSDDDVASLRFIRRAKTLGFTLTEIRELLPAAASGSAGDVLAAARAKLAIVEAEMAEQQAQRQRLVRLIDVCADGGDDCSTLEIASA